MRARSGGVPWSLVFFTVLAQAAAGLCLTGVIFAQVVRAQGLALEGSIRALWGAGLGLLAVAGLAAVTHLGRPARARYVGANLRASWLSRETLLGALLGAGLLFLLASIPRSATLARALEFGTALVGLAFVFAIVRVYRLRTVPAWDHWTTPATFFGTTVLLGVALLAALLPWIASRWGPEPAWLDPALRTLGVAAVLAAVWQTVVANVRHDRFPPAAGTGGLSRREHRLTLGVRVVALLLGAALLFAAAWWGPGTGRSRAPAFLLACLLLVVSEWIGRYRFYASHRRVGL